GRVHAGPDAVAELQPFAAVPTPPRFPGVREDDPLHRIAHGEPVLRVEHQHPVAFKLARPVAPDRVRAADPELFFRGFNIPANAPAADGPHGDGLPLRAYLEVAAVLSFV